jgi:isoquinoline 1-oxidoreductase beta subunit
MTIDSKSASRPARRHFVQATAGLVVGFHLAPRGAGAQTPAPAAAAAPAAPIKPEINAWVAIAADDTVTIRMARSEMGQGTRTGLVQLVAEELECEWSRIRTEYVTPGQSLARNRAWGAFQTAGSQGIRQSQDYVRRGGATARTMLVQAAANGWNVPVAECAARQGTVVHGPSGRTVRYGQVADAAGKLEVPKDVSLKDPKDWKIIGRSVPRIDTADKTTGRLVYGADLKMPGMLVAVPRECPVFGGKVKSFDAAAVARRPGVRHVLKVADTGVAVVADTFWQAKTALDALPIEWDYGPNRAVSSESSAVRQAESFSSMLTRPRGRALRAARSSPWSRARRPKAGRRRPATPRRRCAWTSSRASRRLMMPTATPASIASRTGSMVWSEESFFSWRRM